MHEYCPSCGHKYEKEHGFFYGAMYASYAITVAFSVTIFLSVYLIYPETPYWMHIIDILVGLVVLAPLSYRLGRLVWINLFTGYDHEAIQKFKEKKRNHE